MLQKVECSYDWLIKLFLVRCHSNPKFIVWSHKCDPSDYQLVEGAESDRTS